jgi:prepilin-type N-terminal cleavage/methylation domain-containing protein
MQPQIRFKGFTLIELLVVIAVIGFLVTLAMVALDTVRKKARDARRLADMTQIRKALEMYYDRHGRYPLNTDNDCYGWDIGYYKDDGDTLFIQPLVEEGLMSKVPGDPRHTSQCGGYRYYRYGAGDYGCDSSKGPFYVLGVTDMETSLRPHPDSPGWSCPNRNWQDEFDWVTGAFERP